MEVPFEKTWLQNRKCASQYLPDSWDDYVDHDNILETIIGSVVKNALKQFTTVTTKTEALKEPKYSKNSYAWYPEAYWEKHLRWSFLRK